MPQIIERGEYTPPTLGVRVSEELNAYVDRRLGIRGVVVVGVDPRSGADEAGLRGTSRAATGGIILGDIIQAIDGEEVSRPADLWTVLDRYRPGDEVDVMIRRNGERQTVSVTLSQGAA